MTTCAPAVWFQPPVGRCVVLHFVGDCSNRFSNPYRFCGPRDSNGSLNHVVPGAAPPLAPPAELPELPPDALEPPLPEPPLPPGLWPPFELPPDPLEPPPVPALPPVALEPEPS